MSDPDPNDDTDPTGCPLATGEGADADADEATAPNDPSRGDVAAGSGENDTDDFLRWLPTLAIGHRRRAELVERPSSDGADFAAYACKGRPAAASGPPRLESAVKVERMPDGDRPQGAKDPERDARTVLTHERSARFRWRSFGWGAVALALAAAGAAVAARAERPVGIEKAPSSIGQAAPPPGSAEPAPVLLTTPSRPLTTDVARTAAERTAPFSNAAAADAARKNDSPALPKPMASSARARTAPRAAAWTLPAKDEYFEAP